MISRLTGAVLRGVLVALLIALPSLALPMTTADTAQSVTLLAIAGAMLTLSEYGSSYPCLFEFREAAPFNRVRFAALGIMVLLITLVLRGVTDPSPLTVLLTLIGQVVGVALDLPYSPTAYLTLLASDAPGDAALVRAVAGLALMIAVFSFAAFGIVMRRARWPLAGGDFNVWINLPTFDPTAGADVVDRLIRDGRLNVILGLLLPVLMPVGLRSAGSVFGTLSFANPQTLVWVVSAWAFLPLSLLMRGIAMHRVAAMISARRRVTTAGQAGLVIN